jgi:ABC-type transport system involved in multi-copper enzyme maturation permease subunit
MTVRTMPVKPGRDTGPAGPETDLWRGMLWVTWRQHRGLLTSVSAAFGVAVIGLLVAGLKIRRDYAIVAACHPANSVACLNLSNGFNTDWHLGNGIRVALLAAPVLLAMFAGPPAVARELENRTFRYAWTQGIGRMRWTAAKLTYLGSVITIAALVISQLFTWLFAPFLTTQDLTVLSPAVFETRGIAYAAWTLTAFCLGAFLGTLIRRVLPAMAASLGAYLFLGALTWLYLGDHYPARTFWPMQAFEGGWLLALCALLVAGTLWLVRRYAA